MNIRVYQVLSIVMVLIIFSNSFLSADISSTQSGFIVNIAQSVLNFFNLELDLNILSHIIRKTAHLLEFLALGYLVSMGWKLKMIQIMMIILLVATLDESIQLFSEGRAFSVIDISIDLVGGCIGFFVVKIIRKQMNQIEKVSL